LHQEKTKGNYLIRFDLNYFVEKNSYAILTQLSQAFIAMI